MDLELNYDCITPKGGFSTRIVIIGLEFVCDYFDKYFISGFVCVWTEFRRISLIISGIDNLHGIVSFP